MVGPSPKQVMDELIEGWCEALAEATLMMVDGSAAAMVIDTEGVHTLSHKEIYKPTNEVFERPKGGG